MADTEARSDRSSAAAPRGRQSSAAPPWSMLVCADLGYLSLEPAKLLAADWGRFFADAKVRIEGTVPAGVGQPSFSVELNPATLDDLSPSKLAESLPHLQGLVQLRDTLLSVGDGLTVADALEVIEREQEGGGLRERARGLLESELRSMRGESRVASDKLASILEQLEAAIEGDTRRCVQQGFFNDRRAAWLALRQLATAAGRSSSFAIRVCSGPRDTMTGHLGDILTQCARKGDSPDMVLWDYPVNINMRDMKALSHLAAETDAHDAMLLSSLAEDEPLVQSMVSEDNTGELLLEEHFVPLRRLRANPAARCIVLSGPPVLLDPQGTPPAQAGAAWLVAHDIERLLIDGASPLETTMPSGEDLERNFQFVLANTVRIPPHIAEEAASHGLVFLSDGMRAGQIALPTLVNPDMAETHSAHFGYNLLLNHLRRLTKQRIAATPNAFDDPDELQRALHEQILGTLAPYRIVTSDRAVRVSVVDTTVTVDVNCDRNLADSPLHFELSLSSQGDPS
ncbi:MAG: hypothetical protein GF331_09060 [Chitinivibrionales bacterium]|nr:hypothetical protein [Chitinivibrionales bacterium]